MSPSKVILLEDDEFYSYAAHTRGLTPHWLSQAKETECEAARPPFQDPAFCSIANHPPDSAETLALTFKRLALPRALS